jgi:glutamate N-acetyltransferase/amino-acid N-acetyltransferase
MTINIKKIFSSIKKISKMGDFQEVKHIEGLQVSAVSANLYKSDREDLSLFYFPEGANYAVAYTKNSIVSESITWNRENSKNKVKALIVNTKNANTFTGEQGLKSLDEIAKKLIESLRRVEIDNGYEKSKIKDLIFASTGVIGEQFPVEKIKDTLTDLVNKLKSEHNKLFWLKIASSM